MCTIVDMENDPRAIILQMVKIFEGTKQTIMFTNCGSPTANSMNEHFLAKLV